MRKFVEKLIIVIVIIFLVVVSLQSLASPQEIPELFDIQTLMATPVATIITETIDINEMPFEDNMDLYQYDEPGSIVYMYATIRTGNPSDNSDHTWQEVNDFTKFFFEDLTINTVGKAEVILQVGDESGPLPGELGYNEVVPNGTIQIRGASTLRGIQKSYKIELFSRAGLWRGQRTISLNKHIYDYTRIRNKLSFDLMKDIPNITSLRTQFVHLFVKDETNDSPRDVFVDYGLFTQIEQPNSRFLENHLLDSNGQLYKPNFFEFYRYPDQIRLADDPLYNEDAFSSILEIKGNRDHSKLIELLEKVNDFAIPIDQTFEKYFDADNFLTWKAINILVGNIDTQSQNYFLYSPQNSEKWYFLPWDYDGDLNRQNREIFDLFPYHSWEKGISNEWGVVLHSRLFKIEKYRDLLTAKIEELMTFMTTERIQSLLDMYKPITDHFVTRMPDVLNFDVSMEEYELAYSQIPGEIRLNYDLYFESLNSPMPFYLGVPEVHDGQIEFIWDEAYDFDAEDIRYQFQVSRNFYFSDLVAAKLMVNLPSTQIPMLEPGAYFWRVIATNEDGNNQYAFDYYCDAEGDRRSGMKYFYITPDGNVLEHLQQ